MQSAPAVSILKSALDRDRDLVLARASFGALFDGYLGHAARWGGVPAEPARKMMLDGLAATTLHLGLRPPNEYTAWTLHVREPALSLFFSGDNQSYQVTGRVYSEGVRRCERSRLYLESQRSQREPSRSMVEVDGASVLECFEQFYLKSEQIPSRLFAMGDGVYFFIQGLPSVDRGWLHKLDREAVLRIAEGSGLEEVEQRRYTFGCQCDQSKILQIVRGIFARDPEALFQGEERVQAACPRCGRGYWIGRDEFDIGRVGVS
ncbi:MAG: Hsp33 family molecular chaperone HslO [Deltaproteobacteria bacterium]|nr:Hsp33 family molecular chaperone HslO [Deltaproteobacteria bacterium]